MAEQQLSSAELAARWIQHGMRQRDQKQWTEALESFEKALALDARNPQAWALKARALDEMNNLSEAIRCYKTALELNPNSASTWNNKGYAFRKQQKYSLALECYREAVRLQPNYAKAWYNMGYVLDKQGNYEDAIDAFSHAIELAPDNDKYVASKSAVEATWREFQKVFDNPAAPSSQSISREPTDVSPPIQRANTPTLVPNREIPAATTQISAESISPISPIIAPASQPGLVQADFNPFLDFETTTNGETSASAVASNNATAGSNLSRPHSPHFVANDSVVQQPRDSISMLHGSHENMMPVVMQHNAISNGRVSMDEGLLHYGYVPLNAVSPPHMPQNPSHSGSTTISHLRMSTSSSNSSPNLTSHTHHPNNGTHATHPHTTQFPFPMPMDRTSATSGTPQTATQAHTTIAKQERHKSGDRPSLTQSLHRTAAHSSVSDDTSSSSTGSSAGDTATTSTIVSNSPALIHSRSMSAAATTTVRPSPRPGFPSNPTPSLGIEMHQVTDKKGESSEKSSLTSIMSQSDVASLLSTLQTSTATLSAIPNPGSIAGNALMASPDGSDGEHEIVPVGLSRAKPYLEAIYTQLQNVKTVKDAEKLERALEEMLAAVRVKRSFLSSKAASSSSENEDKCACCWEKPPEMVCIPCGHLCICEECKSKLRQKKCPICSQPVKNIYRVFK
jgi:cytochrome c-type biogenesis protein CcmH/NrfG